MVLPPKDSTATRTAKTALKIAKELTTSLVDMKLFFSVESIDKLWEIVELFILSIC